MSTLPFCREPARTGASQEVTDDAVQLGLVAVFNGLCHLVRILADRGLVTPAELERLHEAMTDPLDDPDHRDDQTVAGFRDVALDVLAGSQRLARLGLRLDDGGCV